MSGPTRRLFVGLMPDDAVRDALVSHQRRWYWAAGRALLADRLHLTLHFLGEVDATREWALRNALAGVDVAPFELVLRTPDLWSGGIAVLRPNEHSALHDLHARLAERLLVVGIEPSRVAFNPHVTLARNAPNAAPPEAAPAVTWTVADFALVWSRKEVPVRYEVLERYGSG